MARISPKRKDTEPSMRLTIEFFGLARELTNARQIEVEVGPDSTLRDVVAALANARPKLVGPIIEPGKAGLVAPYLFNVDGRQTLQDLDYRPEDGQHILLLFALAGG